MTDLKPPETATRKRPLDLRESLIDAGIALLEEDGPSGLTLRRAAARAGVSHAAPAHHFNGLAGLQTAIATRAFILFTKAMQDRSAAAPPDAESQVFAICHGYLDFARVHGGLFHLMFACPEIDVADMDLRNAADGAYLTLRRACLPYGNGGPDPAFEAAVWTMVHGYASLGMIAPNTQSNGTPPPPFADVLKQLLKNR